MDSASRLRLVGRVSYYLGWVFALCGMVVHFGVGDAALRSLSLTQRNLFEGSVMFFLISAVSVLRAGASPKPN
jgi:hypothetical protein